MTVLRITWLREKDRVARWKEEVVLRYTDQECSKRWFEHQINLWNKRKSMASSQGKRGHVCYAEKQVEVWQTFANRAQLALDETTPLYKSM